MRHSKHGQYVDIETDPDRRVQTIDILSVGMTQTCEMTL